ncbi:helix-turn-helix domain-containing protein [Nocardioides sp. YIM 152588]|uniref:PucR family transcriptional regulator n=1 Tax=Nocardioides sp. YIM 152588 TaxID=3158259 RepID=UPI0032E3CB7D
MLGNDAVDWAVEVAARVVDMHAAAGRFPAEAALEARAGCEAGLLHGLTRFALGEPAHCVGASDRALEDARHWARQGLPIEHIFDVLWSTHSVVNDAVLAELHAVGRDLSPADARQVVADLTTYVGNTVRDMTEAYRQERTVLRSSERAQRAGALSAILDGADDPELERALRLRLRAHHLLGVAWTTDDLPDEARVRELDRICAKLSSNLGASGSVVLPRGRYDVLWLTFNRREDVDVAGVIEVEDGLGLAFGGLHRDIAGVRTSYREAEHASRVGLLAGESGCWTYDRVSMVALALSDLTASRAFVSSELDGVLGLDERQRDLRETVRVFLAVGGSRNEAARRLNIAPTTVAYRVQQFQDLLGRPLAPRSLQTALALEIVHHAGDALADPNRN